MSLSLPQNSNDWKLVLAVIQQLKHPKATIVTGLRGKVIGAIGFSTPAPNSSAILPDGERETERPRLGEESGISHCYFCGEETPDDDHYPYCSAICAISVEKS